MGEVLTKELNEDDVIYVEKLISNLKTISVQQDDNTRFRYKVAGRFGNLTPHLKEVDNVLKVSIASTIAITDGKCYKMSFDQLLSALTKNPALTRRKEDVIRNSDTYISTNLNFSLWSTVDEAEVR